MERALLIIGALLLVDGGVITDFMGIAMGGSIIALQLLPQNNRKE